MNNYFFNLVIERARAERDSKKKFLFSAIAIRKDGVVVHSTNEATVNKTLATHAEARLVKKAGHGSTVIVARVTRDGRPAMAKPCPHCQSALKNKRVSRVFYSTGNGMNFDQIRF